MLPSRVTSRVTARVIQNRRARAALIAVTAMLAPLAVYAADNVEVPAETAGPAAVIGFLVVFAAIIGGYVWMTWRNAKKEAAEKRDAAPPA